MYGVRVPRSGIGAKGQTRPGATPALGYKSVPSRELLGTGARALGNCCRRGYPSEELPGSGWFIVSRALWTAAHDSQ